MVLAVAWALGLGGEVRADEPKRPPQDYGAPPPEKGAPDAVTWPARAALFPLWAVTNYGLRYPTGALVKTAERNDWPEEVIDFFTFGPRKQIAIFPSALFDFGLKPSVGFNAEWKYFVADPNTLRLHFGFWGPDWIAARIVDQYALRRGERVGADLSFVQRQDNPYFGMGPRAPSDPRFRFQSTTFDGALEYGNTFWRASGVVARAGVRATHFGHGSCCSELSIDDAAAAGLVEPPPGYHQDFVAVYDRITATLDTRRPRPQPGSGVRLEGRVEGDFSPSDYEGTRHGWIKYGGTAGAAWDVTGQNRVLAFDVDAQLTDPLHGTVPFTELATLGGDRPMSGYIRDRLIDRSSLVATLQYTWPVWVFLDGVLITEVGNVFGPHFDGLAPGLLRLTSGMGVRSNGARDSGFELLVAGGTDPFDQGFRVSSFRLVFGSHHGF